MQKDEGRPQAAQREPSREPLPRLSKQEAKKLVKTGWRAPALRGAKGAGKGAGKGRKG